MAEALKDETQALLFPVDDALDTFIAHRLETIRGSKSTCDGIFDIDCDANFCLHWCLNQG